MRNLLLILLFALTLFSCQKEKPCCVTKDTVIVISYYDSNGNSLFNNNSFDPNQIKLYYKNGNDYQYQYHHNLDFPKMYEVIDQNGIPGIKLFPSEYFSNNKSTTLIELNSEVIDTIIGEFNLENGNVILNKVFYNGEEKIYRSFSVVK